MFVVWKQIPLRKWFHVSDKTDLKCNFKMRYKCTNSISYEIKVHFVHIKIISTE